MMRALTMSRDVTSGIVHGEVTHRRLRPARNAFTYPAFCLRCRCRSWPRCPSLRHRVQPPRRCRFHDRDHGACDGSAAAAVDPRAARARRRRAPTARSCCYAFPRMFGYVFNPVSFWVCHDRAARVRAVLCEVCNTFGERHNYLLAHPDGRAARLRRDARARKVFHVSPFCDVKGRYAFRFHFGAERWLARIDYFDDDDGAAAARDAISGAATPLSRAAVRALLWRYRCSRSA